MKKSPPTKLFYLTVSFLLFAGVLSLGVALCLGLTSVVDQIGSTPTMVKRYHVHANPLLGGEMVALNRTLKTDSTTSESDLLSGRLLPRDGNLELREVHLSQRGTDYVVQMPGLTRLDLSAATLDDQCFARLAHSGIKWLGVTGVNTISDAGLAGVSTCQLERLALSSNRITSKGYNAIANSRTINDLDFTGSTNFGDADLDYLSSHCHQLSVLNLSGTSVTCKSLSKLQRLKHLVTLRLERVDIKDVCLAPLVAMQLNFLGLDHTTTSDAGLRQIAKMRSLKTVELEFCPNVTAEGIEELRKQLPNCHIQREDISQLL